MRLLLDTAAFIYAVASPERLSKRAATVIGNPANLLELSAISISEIAIKASVGKLVFPSAAMRQAFHDLDIRVQPYTTEHALRLFDLPLHHGDPFDRQIIVQGLSEGIPIVTPDEKFSNYTGIKVIW